MGKYVYLHDILATGNARVTNPVRQVVNIGTQPNCDFLGQKMKGEDYWASKCAIHIIIHYHVRVVVVTASYFSPG